MTKSNIIGMHKSMNVGNSVGFHEALFQCMSDVFGTTRDQFDTSWKPRVDSDTGTLRGYTQPTSDALFDEWKQTRDAGWLYSHPEYKWDSLGVSAFQTSATTTTGISMLNKAGIVPKRIFDWGAGPGFSSIIMAKNFPNAEVHYNELNTDLVKIFEWFKDRSGLKNLKVVQAPEGDYDLIEAYEIVEHIPHASKPKVGDPITETALILKNTTPDAYFLHATCWNAERKYTTLGHFLTYQFDEKLITTTRASMHFKECMARRGWQFQGAGWNSRPLLYKKV